MFPSTTSLYEGAQVKVYGTVVGYLNAIGVMVKAIDDSDGLVPRHVWNPAHRNFDSILAMINHIDGGIAFAKNVDAEYAAKLKVAWDEVLREHGYPV